METPSMSSKVNFLIKILLWGKLSSFSSKFSIFCNLFSSLFSFFPRWLHSCFFSFFLGFLPLSWASFIGFFPSFLSSIRPWLPSLIDFLTAFPVFLPWLYCFLVFLNWLYSFFALSFLLFMVSFPSPWHRSLSSSRPFSLFSSYLLFYFFLFIWPSPFQDMFFSFYLFFPHHNQN